MYTIKPFKKEFIDDAAKLFIESFNHIRSQQKLIPMYDNLYEKATSLLMEKQNNPGYAAFKGNKLAGYIIESFHGDFMGHKTAFSLDLSSHSSTSEDKELIYQKLYEKIAQIWIDNKCYAHNIQFFAPDMELSKCFFRLGFGMTHFELMRDLEIIENINTEFIIKKMTAGLTYNEIEKEHYDYYINSPLFWINPEPFKAHYKEDVANGKIEGFAAVYNDEIIGYFRIRKGTAETWLFADKDNVQIKGAYLKPQYRHKGYGKALLQNVINWAKEHNYKRLYVEGESANIYGGNFWVKHFKPVSYFVRRCVDNRAGR